MVTLEWKMLIAEIKVDNVDIKDSGGYFLC